MEKEKTYYEQSSAVLRGSKRETGRETGTQLVSVDKRAPMW